MSPNMKPQKSKKQTGRSSKPDEGLLSAEELAAMKETLKERKAAASQEEAEQAVLEKIAEMPQPDRGMAERLHALIKSTEPDLAPRTWYGMPAYAKDGKVICFFQNAQKFKARYSTLGFSDTANLDDGEMWPTSFALKALTPAVEKSVEALVKRAVG